VTALVHLTPLDPHYPSRLRGAPGAPASITVRGDPLEADRVVAVVGSRECTATTERFARALARRLAADGITIASGGAVGIDTAAHLGALAAGGRTWVVAPTGCERVFPEENAALFEAIARGPGAMLWPFAPSYSHRSAFHARNRILVALADAVVVVQAGDHSGALHAAACARRSGKPLWVVPPPPWASVGDLEGSRRLLEQGAHPLTSADAFVRALARLPRPRPRLPALSPAESATWAALSNEPLHLDHVARTAGLPAQATAAALLTLSLENVVVEGPPGFFRRHDRH